MWRILGVIMLVAGGMALPTPAPAVLLVEFQEDLGNFPDAIEVGGGIGVFNSRSINGGAQTVSGPGVLFTLRNTSWGNGDASRFTNDPDGDFAVRDVLTPEAAAAIAASQPFGIYSFGAKLPESFDTAGLQTGAPAGFDLHIEVADGDPGFKEFNFVIEINAPAGPATGLLFDDLASGINAALFPDPRFGLMEFFIAAPAGFNIADLPPIRNSPGIDVRTEMTWAGGPTALATTFDVPGTDFDGEELRPRGEIQGVLQLVPVQQVPEPGTLALMGLALAGLGLFTRRRRPPR